MNAPHSLHRLSFIVDNLLNINNNERKIYNFNKFHVIIRDNWRMAIWEKWILRESKEKIREAMAMSSEKKKKYGSLTVDNREENKLEGWAKGFNTVECG